MAFPGTYNFSYYRGDTYEFKLYPKTSSGAVFDLSGYDRLEGVQFTIASARGPSGFDSQLIGFSAISEDRTFITCRINPEIGNLLNPTLFYEYDVEIKRTATDPVSGETTSFVYTLVTGRISVSEQITGASSPDEVG
jgi:hypothetical protein